MLPPPHRLAVYFFRHIFPLYLSALWIENTEEKEEERWRGGEGRGQKQMLSLPSGEKASYFSPWGCNQKQKGWGYYNTRYFFHTCPSDFIFAFPFSCFSSLWIPLPFPPDSCFSLPVFAVLVLSCEVEGSTERAVEICWHHLWSSSHILAGERWWWWEGGQREAGREDEARKQLLGLKRGTAASSQILHTHTHTQARSHTYSDELDHEALKHTPSAAASLRRKKGERDQRTALTLSLSPSHTRQHTHTHRQTRAAGKIWALGRWAFGSLHSSPSPHTPLPLFFLLQHSLSLSLPPVHLVLSGCMFYCCVRAKDSQREACRGRALTDPSPPINKQSRRLRRHGSPDQVRTPGSGTRMGELRFRSGSRMRQSGGWNARWTDLGMSEERGRVSRKGGERCQSI